MFDHIGLINLLTKQAKDENEVVKGALMSSKQCSGSGVCPCHSAHWRCAVMSTKPPWFEIQAVIFDFGCS